MATEALLVGETSDPHHHRVAVPRLREERQRGALAAYLVLCVVQVGQVLDLRNGHESRQARSQRQSQDRLLVEQGVEDTPGSEPAGQPTGGSVHAALASDVLAE